MLVERPPRVFRSLFRGARWTVPAGSVALTFDDGPHPDVTPWVLDELDAQGVKATFFMVGDNARRWPALVEEALARGHAVGNHTMHHLQGLKVSKDAYLTDLAEASLYIPGSLFRPPHGMLRLSQLREIRKSREVIMYDIVSRDYDSRLSADEVYDNVRRYARSGSIIVFHDSLKAERNLRGSLRRSIEWLKTQGYEFVTLPMAKR